MWLKELFPAHAGMNRSHGAKYPENPRTRGDEPLPIKESHTNLFPAHAGMNRESVQYFQFQFPVPRTRGDEPDYKFREWVLENCSPHTRG